MSGIERGPNGGDDEMREPSEAAPEQAAAPEVRSEIREIFRSEKDAGAFRAIEAVRRAGATETEVHALARELVAETIASGDVANGWRRMRSLKAGTDVEWRAIGALAFRHMRTLDPDSARTIAYDLWGPSSAQVREIDAEMDRKRGKRRGTKTESDPVLESAFVNGLRAALVGLVGEGHEIIRTFEANMASTQKELVDGVLTPEPEPVRADVDVEDEDVEPITLASDATFADLFAAVDAASEGMEEVFSSELIDHFDEDLVLAVEDIRNNRELASMSRVVEFFTARGYSQRDLTTYLPIRFSRKRR